VRAHCCLGLRKTLRALALWNKATGPDSSHRATATAEKWSLVRANLTKTGWGRLVPGNPVQVPMAWGRAVSTALLPPYGPIQLRFLALVVPWNILTPISHEPTAQS
jgi:hypothetical protein